MPLTNVEPLVQSLVADVTAVEATVKLVLSVPPATYEAELFSATQDDLAKVVADLSALPKDAIWQKAEDFALQNYQTLALVLRVIHIFKPVNV